MRIEIPGYKTMDLKYLILDYNGTIAKDGIIPESVKERLKKLSGIYEIYVLTADTHGTARKICEGLPLKIQTFPGNAAAEEKRKIIEQLGGCRPWHCSRRSRGEDSPGTQLGRRRRLLRQRSARGF